MAPGRRVGRPPDTMPTSARQLRGRRLSHNPSSLHSVLDNDTEGSSSTGRANGRLGSTVSFDQVVMDSVSHVTKLVGAAGNLFGPPPQSPAVSPTIDGGGGSGGGRSEEHTSELQSRRDL